MGDNWGFINKKGRYVIPLQYEGTHGFGNNGLAIVKSNDKWGVINKKGKFVVQPQFDMMIPYTSGNVSTVMYFDSDYTPECAIVDKKGKFVTNFGLYDQIYSYDDGFVVGKVNDHGSVKYGVLNNKGKEIIPVQYDGIKSGYMFESGFGGGGNWCSVDDCFEEAEYGEFCEEHAPYCASSGCYNPVEEYNDYCDEHNDMPYCSNTDCYNYVDDYYDDYCYLHTGKDYCIYSTCYNRVDDNADYYCSAHSYLE